MTIVRLLVENEGWGPRGEEGKKEGNRFLHNSASARRQ
jgi:hypothetical protein